MSKICKLCNRGFSGRRALAAHLRSHDVTSVEYYDRFERKYCKACGKKLYYKDAFYYKYCSQSCAKTGSNHWKWKGGTAIDSTGGYTLRHLHTYSLEHRQMLSQMLTTGNYIHEHRAEMAIAIGRALTSQEHVHHKNGVRSDNRLDNLELRLGAHGPGFSSNTSMHCPECGHEDIALEFTKKGS